MTMERSGIGSTSQPPCSVCGGKHWTKGDIVDGYTIVPCWACNILGDVRPDMNDWPNMTPCDFKTQNTTGESRGIPRISPPDCSTEGDA